VGPEFEVLTSGDSVQAASGSRFVYVSSMSVGQPASPTPAGAIRAMAAKGLGSGERLAYSGPKVEGDAEIRQEGDQWQLKATMCADGTAATCAIGFPGPEDRAWAIAVWQSLSCE
jgi:hypothetical protein